jgi:arabinogalactan oligomer/maltooligosaccharide transport system permease protein
VLAPLALVAGVGVRHGSRRSPHRVAYAYIGPALVGLGVLVLVPFLYGVALAFTRATHGEVVWVGLENFVDILSSAGRKLTEPLSFYFTLVVTLAWTLANVVLHTGIGLGLALILKDPTLRFKGVYRVLLIVPWAVPSYITALVWKGMFNQQYGLVNHVLSFIGVAPVAWFSEFWTSFTANVVTNTWLGFPFMMVVSLGALQSIPGDLYEAASVDGASKWQQFRHITLPLLRPALVPAVILGSVWTFNMFNIIYLVSGGQPNHSTDILITQAYRFAFEQDRYGYAAAYSVLIFLILVIWSFLTQRATRSEEA